MPAFVAVISSDIPHRRPELTEFEPAKPDGIFSAAGPESAGRACFVAASFVVGNSAFVPRMHASAVLALAAVFWLVVQEFAEDDSSRSDIFSAAAVVVVGPAAQFYSSGFGTFASLADRFVVLAAEFADPSD